MPIIDNKRQTMQNALINAIDTSMNVDICVGYFYMSGFEALAEELRDKHVRVLVGKEVDPKCVADISMYAKEEDVDLSKWQPRIPTKSAIALKNNYIDTLVGFINESDTFDNPKVEKLLDLFIEKIANGTLEIKKTFEDYHAKFYVIHNNIASSQKGDFPGTVFIGSSNFTFRGLVGQGELNDSFRDKDKFIEYSKLFETLWSDSKSLSIADVHTKSDFIKQLKDRTWKFRVPTPYELYIKVLHEYFKSEISDLILTPKKITNGHFIDLEYQIDAIKMGLERLNRYDGVIVADVVGLGKSIIASAIAKNLDIKTVIIAPPHLIPQWEDYKEEFKIQGSKVFSTGEMLKVYERYSRTEEPLLLILDEAHRYRNEDTTDYKLLHQVCRSHPKNKVLILTATPFNNAPKDIFSLVKLFQTPGYSTIRSVDNLSMRFRELIDRYRTLRRNMTKGIEQTDIDIEANEIAIEQRRLIENVIIRRSRLDLKQITRYRKDLEKQKISFATVIGPELMEYNLGELFELYMSTLDKITGAQHDGLIGARYKPTLYDLDVKEFKKMYGDNLDEFDLQAGQRNMADFMRRLLVMRFESSKYAFRSTLEKMIETNKVVEKWYVTKGLIPIMKKGILPDPTYFKFEDGDLGSDIEDQAISLKDEKGLILIPKEMLAKSEQFISDLRSDISLLQEIHENWFGEQSIFKDLDPKIEDLAIRIRKLVNENNNRKIVIFSAYADTVNNLYNELIKRGIKKVMKYTASDAKSLRKTINENFDASYREDHKKNDFDILIATDAISEGFNLHRAGVVINYDIPYNPTRVIQRVGRINRINKKVFENLYVFNSFPTAVGEAETRIKQISTLKMNLINAIVGSDTKHLTSDESLVSYFKNEYNKAEDESEQLSWDSIHRENYDIALEDKDLMQRVNMIPKRVRISRPDKTETRYVVYGKKGDESIFVVSGSDLVSRIASAEEAIPLFEAKIDEVSFEVSESFSQMFEGAKEKLFGKTPLPSIKGRRSDAIKVILAIKNVIPNAEAYCLDLVRLIKEYDDISDGSLKEISQLSLQDTNQALEKLKMIAPERFITNVIERVENVESGKEILLFAEEKII